MSKINKILFDTNADLTEAFVERGAKQLFRLSVIIDVLYALLIYNLFTFLPRPEVDHFTKDELFTVLASSSLNYMVMGMGFLLILIYWSQSNLQFGNLTRSDSKHATLSFLQVFSLMIYLYFVRLDVEMDGAIITLIMESIFLTLSGLFGLWSWHYANSAKLTSENLSNLEANKVYLKLLPEPIVAALSLPFAFYGPDIWTLSWLMLIPIGILSKRIQRKIIEKKSD